MADVQLPPVGAVPDAVVLEAARAPELLTVREFNHLLGAYGVACERSAPTEMKQHGEVVAAYGRALAVAATACSDATDELEAKLAVQAAEIKHLRWLANHWTREYQALAYVADGDDPAPFIAACSCQSWPPEGPSEECAVHGAVRAFNEATTEIAVQAAEIERLRADRDTLAAVGRLYLDCLDDDPENEMLTLVEAYLVSDVRDAVERAQIAAFPQVAGSEETQG